MAAPEPMPRAPQPSAAGQPELTVVFMAYQQAAPGLPPAERQLLEALHTTLRQNILALATDWVQARQRLYRQGWRPTWVSRQEFAKTGRFHGLSVLREAARHAYRRWRWQLLRQ